MGAALRRITALAVLVLFLGSFVNLRNAEPAAWSVVIERLQFVPAFLGSLSGKEWAAAILAGLVVMTLVFGRVYCSFLCPLGILQDIAIRLRALTDRLTGRKKKGAALRYMPPVPVVRYAVLALVLLSMFGSATLLLTWLDPYTIAARLAASIANPLAAEANNLLADTSAGQALDAVRTPPAWARYGFATALAAAFVLVPLLLAWWKGRLYCNTVCPVGALLGLLSRAPLLRLGIDENACTRCGSCLKACKAHCIDLKRRRIDTARCVNCYNCSSTCPNGGLRLRWTNPFRRTRPAGRPKRQTATPTNVETPNETVPNAARRAFLGAALCTVPAALASCRPGRAEGLSSNPAAPGDNVGDAVSPPGSRSVPRFLDRCTGCGLCITACPTRVLQPALLHYGLRGIMKPRLDFTKGFCNFDCNICTQICPEGALLPLPLPEKKKTQIALASFHRDRCIVQQNRTECGACTEHCPTKALYTKEESFPIHHRDKCTACGQCEGVCPEGAVSLVVDPDGREYAVFDDKKCVACGKCAEVCPSQAISVQRLLIPALAPELCIGCGACAYACPVRPERAMQLTPRARHLEAVVHVEAPAENPVTGGDFPF